MSRFRNIFLKVSLAATAIATLVAFPGSYSSTVYAQVTGNENISICNFIQAICDALGAKSGDSGSLQLSAYNFVKQRGNLILSVVFIGIILISVYIIIKAAIKYIRS